MYKVLAATHADINEGWIWISHHKFANRTVIKILNKSNNAVVFCEALEIEENFQDYYNQPNRVHINLNEKTIVMNNWYRKHLGGIETKKHHNLEVSVSDGWLGKIRANIGHPQVVVRLATWLGVMSVFLGGLGVVLGVLSIFMSSLSC